ncbi:uncharacterized protein HaLaN_01594 [Haematococcus lacustris]|uniref:Uncharacterized protein n=1 Tax=Haematococcus lacustris TaxID=44745 RepID=A0A699YLJ1_HAELA|nr:uncharacterized protein HaLaN_01594 [Haematococcus lacustris]
MLRTCRYTLPSGDVAFVYRARKTRVDELEPPKAFAKKGFYDAKGIDCNAFDHDWGRCESKERFQRKMQKLTKGRPELVEGLKQELRNRYQGLLRIFDYYASLSSGDPFSLHLNAWGLLPAGA